VNFLWYTNDSTLRVVSNPKPIQTDYFGTGPLVHFFGFLNKVPMIETLMVVILLVGVIYYLGFQRNKPWTPVVPPEEEVETVTA
jgi:hypothetical protein